MFNAKIVSSNKLTNFLTLEGHKRSLWKSSFLKLWESLVLKKTKELIWNQSSVEDLHFPPLIPRMNSCIFVLHKRMPCHSSDTKHPRHLFWVSFICPPFNWRKCGNLAKGLNRIRLVWSCHSQVSLYKSFQSMKSITFWNHIDSNEDKSAKYNFPKIQRKFTEKYLKKFHLPKIQCHFLDE